MSARVGLALALAMVAAALSYAVERAIEALVFPAANPVALITSADDPLGWRVAIALYVGGMAAFGAWELARRRPLLAARLIGPGALAATLAVAAQATLWP